jgi:hypothetical protein
MQRTCPLCLSRHTHMRRMQYFVHNGQCCTRSIRFTTADWPCSVDWKLQRADATGSTQ